MIRADRKITALIERNSHKVIGRCLGWVGRKLLSWFEHDHDDHQLAKLQCKVIIENDNQQAVTVNGEFDQFPQESIDQTVAHSANRDSR